MRRIIIAAALLTLAATASARAERSVTHSFTSTTSVPAVRSLIIDIPVGEVRVVNGPKAEIRLSGVSRREFDSWDSRASHQKIVDDVSAEVYVNGDEAVVRRKFGPNAQSWRSQKFTTVEVTLAVPAGTSLAFDTSVGEVHVDGDFGNVDIDLRAGEVHVTTPRASVRELNASCRIGEVHTNLGREIIDREGVFPGRTHYENPAGRSRVNAHVTVGEVHVDLTQ